MRLVGKYPRRGLPIKKAEWKKLLECGLLSYSDKVDSGIMYDKTGQTRDAVQGESLDGDGSMYYDTGFIYDENFEVEVNGNFERVDTLQRHGNRLNSAGDGCFFGVTASGEWDTLFGNSQNTGGIADVNTHTFKLNKTGLYIDGVLELPISPTSFTQPLNFYLLARNIGTGISHQCYFNLNWCKITKNGKTYTLDIPGLSSDIIQLVNLDDSSDFIQGTLMLPSATPTSFTDKVVSIEDMYGYSVSKALGKNLFDKSVAITNMYIDRTTGLLSTSIGNYATNYILIKPDTIYYMNNVRSGGSLTGHAFYDENKLFISGITGNGVVSFTTPINAKFVRLSLSDETSIQTAQLELGSTPTTYEPYQGYYRDSLLTEPYQQGAIIPCDKRGISFSFVSDGQGGSLQPRADFVGKIANNFVKCDSDGTINPSGLYVKNDQVYGHITSTDANEILWDKTLQEVKTVLFENINYHNQFFINADETRISYYDSELTEPCLTKALKLEKLVEPLEDINGVPLYDIDGSRLYAYKDGVEEVR